MGSLWSKSPPIGISGTDKAHLVLQGGLPVKYSGYPPTIAIGWLDDRVLMRLARALDHAAKPVCQGFILEVGEFPGIHEHAVIGADFIPDMRLVGI